MATVLAENPIRPAPSALTEQRLSAHFDYPVWFTRDVLGLDNPVLVESIARLEPRRRHRVMAVVDEGVARAWPDLTERLERYAGHHGERLELLAPVAIEPGGELAKQGPASVERVHRAIHDHGLDRHACVIAIGGGAVLDMVGYATATAHRGLRLVRLPTTVLAQNDAGVGVKNAINAFGVKNFLGTFAPPFAVIDDFDFLDTLSERDRRAGMAEAVKVALIRDRRFYETLRRDMVKLRAFEDEPVETMVRRAAELHLDHIASNGDPFEQGSARPLDYGHWAAHKLESLSEHELSHGDAVAIGMALDGAYAMLDGSLPFEEHESILALLEGLGFRLWHPALRRTDATGRRLVLDGLDEFRQHLGGDLALTLLTGIGSAREVTSMDTQRVLQALDLLEQRDRARCG